MLIVFHARYPPIHHTIAMHTKDSLIGLNLRLGQKRPLPSTGADRAARALPIDELRAKVVAKRRRTGDTAGPSSAPRQKYVRFNTKGNRVHAIRNSLVDLSAAWMSREESNRVRAANIRTIELVRAGKLDANDTIRGLELHSSQELLQKKIENGERFVQAVLEQQRFQRCTMGRVCDVMLSRLSSVLSSEDAKDAAHTASMDEKEAILIHAEEAYQGRQLCGQRQERQEINHDISGEECTRVNSSSGGGISGVPKQLTFNEHNINSTAAYPSQSLYRLVHHPNPVLFPASPHNRNRL